MKKTNLFSLCVLAQLSLPMGGAYAYELPTMGWSSWNAYGFKISEAIIKSQADAIVRTGLKDAGYIYLNIDDGFFGGRDADGNLLIHPDRFPNGMRTVVDYIHGKGLKAGIYSDAGRNTCASFWGGDKIGIGVGLYEHDQQDIDFYFKDLNFDFIKVDFCGGHPGHNYDGLALPEKERYTAIHQAIVNTGRTDVRLNVCRWAFPGTWVHDVATSWRISEDIYVGWNSIKSIVGQNLYLSAYATEGKFNDMDMLEVGRGLTTEEDKTHFGMWCIMSSPLLIGCDMTTISDEALALMTNEELIALNQDPLALQAYVVDQQSGVYLLVKDVEEVNGASRAIAIYNSTDKEATYKVDLLSLDMGGKVAVRDLFEKENVGEYMAFMDVTVPAHGTRIYKLTATQRYERVKYEAETAWLSAYQELSNNQSVVSGIYEEVAFASGGAKAGWLGRSEENDLQWRNVYSEDGGEYTMALTYITGESRNIYVQVNGGAPKMLTVNSGGWDVPATVNVDVTLNKGNNVIRLYNAAEWMPDIDCMELHKRGSLDVYKRRLETAQTMVGMLLEEEWTTALRQKLETAYAASQNVVPGKEAYLEAAAQLYAVYDEVILAKESIRKLTDLLAVCKDNLERSMPGADADNFSETMNRIQTEADASLTADEMDAIYEDLKNTAVAYHTSEAAHPAEGEKWDVTFLLQNPTFEGGDDSGWTMSPTVRSGVAEFWNKNFTLYQTVRNVKNGNYELRVQALYRTGKNDGGKAYREGTETIPANISIVTTTQPIASLYSVPYPGDISSFDTVEVLNGYANSMATASVCFGQGAYWNTVAAQVSNNRIRVGLVNKGSQDDSWCCFDNFRLYYCGGDPALSIQDTGAHQSGKVDVYSIDGVLCKEQVPYKDALNGLHKGIYIVGGKKVEVK